MLTLFIPAALIAEIHAFQAAWLSYEAFRNIGFAIPRCPPVAIRGGCEVPVIAAMLERYGLSVERYCASVRFQYTCMG
jgi:hypothetical protein